MSRYRQSPTAAATQSLRTILVWLASPAVAAMLLATLALVLAVAAILEVNHGSAYSSWFVYKSGWFLGLLAFCGVHLVCAAASRFPWKRQQAGLLITHAGLLALLAGAAISSWGRSSGRITLAKGQSVQHMVVAEEGQIKAFWVGRPQEPPCEFPFTGGPVDWPAARVLDAGEMGGIKTRILAYHRHATADETWVTDTTGVGVPALKFRASGPNGVHIAEGWLVDQQFGDAVAVGPIRLQLERAVSDRMLDDFLQSSHDGLDDKGRLSMYYGDVVKHVALDAFVGQKITLGNTGVVVEIAEYLPNAMPDRLGNFRSQGERPKNPMVELRVHLPGESQPLRQIAFAKDPLLNLDGVYPRVCPVKFRFNHPAVPRQTAIEFLQTSAGTLHARLLTAHASAPSKDLHPGDTLRLPGNFSVEIVEHIPRAARQVTFAASDVPSSRDAQDESEPAALVEVMVGGQARQVWLRRNDPAYGQSALTFPGGTLALSYESGRMPLGFSLELVEVHREPIAGGADGTEDFSTVRIRDARSGMEENRVIATNQPLTHRNYMLSAGGIDEGGHGQKVASFSATCDPGAFWKYFGLVTACMGIAVIISTRAYAFACRSSPLEGTHPSESATTRGDQPEDAVRRAA